MKIKKILFFGIVLVMFNAVYLAAQTSADTMYVRSSTAKPGDTLSVTYGVDINTTGVAGGFQGVIMTFRVDSTLASMLDTAAGAWYTYTSGYGAVLRDNASSAIVSWTQETGVLSLVLYGVNINLLTTAGLIPADQKGDLVVFKFHVASNTPEGSYPVTLGESAPGAADGCQFTTSAGTYTPYPTLQMADIIVANIPNYDALQMGGMMNALIGDTILVPIKVENMDTVASGSFAVNYPSDMLTLGSPVTAGARGTGMTFTSTGSTVNSTTMRVSVSFSGSTVAPGGLGNLCLIPFVVSGMPGMDSVSLGSVVLKGTAGTNLADMIAPTTPSSMLDFFYGDSLIVDVQAGDYSAINTSQRRVKMPIRLVNRKPVSAVRFYVQPDPSKPAGILKIYQVNLATRTAGWIVNVDTASGQVIAYAPSPTQLIPAGNDVIFNISMSIMRPLSPAQLPIDVPMLMTGIDIRDDQAMSIGVQKVNGTISLDDRVPNDGEGIDQGSALPKAFALGQNSPNPFNPSTTISYQIPEDAGAGARFSLNVYDIRGSLIKILADGFKAPGTYKAFWDGTNNHGQQVSSGVYFYRFSSDKYTSTRKMILLK